MDKQPNPHPRALIQLSHGIRHAVREHDWQKLKQIDAEIARYLTRYPHIKQHPDFKQPLFKLKQIHQFALCQIQIERDAFKQKLNAIEANHERAKAYAISMELNQ